MAGAFKRNKDGSRRPSKDGGGSRSGVKPTWNEVAKLCPDGKWKFARVSDKAQGTKIYLGSIAEWQRLNPGQPLPEQNANRGQKG